MVSFLKKIEIKKLNPEIKKEKNRRVINMHLIAILRKIMIFNQVQGY